MALKKVTSANHLPGEGDERFPVHSKQFNAAITTLSVGTAVTSLLDSSGGTPAETIPAIEDANTKVAIASLATKVEALTVALRSAGIIT
tara:strand:+ start:1137 stop:1403 length:267 start_codon:yes stop_codon:yes gene_type:complete